jgi:hypothetical protein
MPAKFIPIMLIYMGKLRALWIGIVAPQHGGSHSAERLSVVQKVIRDHFVFAAVAVVSQGPAKTFESGRLSAAKQHLPWRHLGRSPL